MKIRLTAGLEASGASELAVVDSIALYCSRVGVTRRTLLAELRSTHDLIMALDALHCERLIDTLRWVNFSISQDE